MSTKDSTFLGYAEDTRTPASKRKVLMVKRNDEKGLWYLPGGGQPYPHYNMRESIECWLERQTSLRKIDVEYLGHWKLSDGTMVRLVKPSHDLPTPINLSPRHGGEYVMEIGWKTHAQVVEQHLAGLTPWAQFKMAMFSLDPAHYVTWNNQPKGDSFGDDFRSHDGEIWTHPKFR